MRLNTVFAGVAALGILSAAPAFAADLPPPVVAPAVIAEAPAFSWQGFYFGVGGGLAAGRMHYPWDLTYNCPQTETAIRTGNHECPFTLLSGEFELTASGFIAGPQIGFNIQRNSLVLGIVADINWSSYTGELAASLTLPNSDTYDVALGSTVDWYGTLRARLGFAFGDQGRALAYITGGLAYGSTTHYYELNGPGSPPPIAAGSLSFTNLGWAAGAGVEVAITDRLSFQTEYLYVDLGTNTLFQDNWGPWEFQLDAVTAFHTIKAGFNFRVGGN